MAPRASSLFGRGDVGFETLPFGITEIGRVAPFHGSERKSSTSPSLFQTVSLEKLFDNSKLFLVWAPTSEQKRLKRSHFVVLTATGSRSEGLQRFIKQFQKKNSQKLNFR